jgi:hypothetical protein
MQSRVRLDIEGSVMPIKRSIAVLSILSALNVHAAQGSEDPSVAAIRSELMKRLTKCWVAPAAARKQNLYVTVQFRLNADGTLYSLPKVLNSSENSVFISLKGSVVKAVVDCQPYKLPADKYELWRDNTIKFVPDMRPPRP